MAFDWGRKMVGTFFIWLGLYAEQTWKISRKQHTGPDLLDWRESHRRWEWQRRTVYFACQQSTYWNFAVLWRKLNSECWINFWSLQNSAFSPDLEVSSYHYHQAFHLGFSIWSITTSVNWQTGDSVTYLSVPQSTLGAKEDKKEKDQEKRDIHILCLLSL